MMRVVDVLRFAATIVAVLTVLAPTGYAMGGRIGLAWAASGAIVWTTLFGYAAHRTGRSFVSWGLAGGLICGTIWAFGEIVVTWVEHLNLGTWRTLVIVAVSAGVAGGALIGASFGKGANQSTDRALSSSAKTLGASLGLVAGLGTSLVAASLATPPPLYALIAWPLLGGVAAALTAPIGRAMGLWFRPSVAFFDELGPYLREMTIPLAAFAVGYFALTILFGGLYGAAWRLDPHAFAGLPAPPSFWDFVYFSLLTASTANTDVKAASPLTQMLVSAEVVLGLGWLIAVFAALSAHLAPRLEAIARGKHRLQNETWSSTALRD